MASKNDTALMKTLRDSGLRKKVARAVTAAAGKDGESQGELISETVERLRAAAAELEGHGSRRSEAAKKAARTRKRTAEERSAAARKAARTRARSRARAA
jgi:hypothetical protein